MSTKAKLTEAEFLAQVLQLAKLRGWRTAHFRPARTASGWRTPVQGDGKGFPDLLMIRGARLVVAELKRDRKAKLTTEQAEWFWAWERMPLSSGVRVCVWTPSDWETIEGVLA